MRLTLVAILLLASLPGALGAVAPYRAAVDPRVLEDTASNQVSSFLVVLRSQANRRALAAQSMSPQARGQIVYGALRQAANSSQPAVRAHLDSLGAKYKAYWIVNLIVVEGDRAVVDAMARRPDVAAIEPNRPFRVELPQAQAAPQVAAGVEWNIDWVNAPDLWALGYAGQGLVYASADTGVQWDHPALQPHYRGWDGATADHNYDWWDAIREDINPYLDSNPCGYASAVPCDDEGHGTHVMGTGVGDDGLGNQIGVAPGAKWIGCRNMDQNYGIPQSYIDCLQFFIAPTDLAGQNPDPSKHADVVSNSYGCPPSEGCSISSLEAAAQAVRAAGIFMSVAAGNSGPSCPTVSDPPAIYESVFTVGATNYQADSIASFSSRGPVTVGASSWRKPDLVAPGVSIRSSYPLNSYSFKQGTSMATPHVAGAVLLLWSAYPELRGNIGFTESLLENSAVHLTTSQGCGGDSPTQVPNNVYGYGRLDARAAYDLMQFILYAPFKYYFPVVGK